MTQQARWVEVFGLTQPYGKCQCGCGGDTSIAKTTKKPTGLTRGQPVRFIHGHNGKINISAPEGFKVCTRCGETKSLDRFYQYKSGEKKGRYRHHCASCFQETFAERFSDPQKRLELTAKRREWRKNNPERVKEIKLKTENKNWERTSARRAVAYQVRKSSFPPAWTMVCEICDEAQAKNWHHHKGYDGENRLNVIAVCMSCHFLEHKELL